MEAVHVVGGMATDLGGKSPSRAQGQNPGRGPGGRSPPEAEENVKLVYNF